MSFSEQTPSTGTGFVIDDSMFGDVEKIFQEDQERIRKAQQEAEAHAFKPADPNEVTEGVTQGSYAKAVEAHDPTSPTKTRRRVLISAGVATGLVAATAGVSLLTSSPSGTQRPAAASIAHTVTPLVRDAPPGWSRTPVWSHPVTVVSNIAATGNNVAYLSAAGVVNVDDANGKSVLTSSPTQYTQGAVVGIAKTGDGQNVALVSQKSDVRLWRIAVGNTSPAGTPVTLPSGASASWGSGALLVSQGTTAWTVKSDGTLNKVPAPDGYTTMGAFADGSVVVSKSGDGWSIMSGSSPKPVSASSPQGVKGKMRDAWTSGGVMVAWGETADTNKRIVAFYDVRSGKLLASGALSSADVNKGLPLAVSTDQSHASAGPLLADLKNGTTTYVPGWNAVSADDSAVYGSTGTDSQEWGPTSSHPVKLSANVAVPWGALSPGGAVVVDLNAQGQQSLAMLRRN